MMKNNKLKPMVNPTTYVGNGIDHLLIGYTATTPICFKLMPKYRSYFTHNILGKFVSIENFKMYLSTKERDDRFRVLNIKDALVLWNNSTKITPPNLDVIIADALHQMVVNSATLTKEIVETTLPFDIYNIRKSAGIKLCIRPINSIPYIQALEEIRKALKENREPMFNFLKDTELSIAESIAAI